MRGRPDEEQLVARYFAPLAMSPGAYGLLDDAAVLEASSDDLVLTVDAIVAGVHFFPDDQPEDIARKALRVNLSDLAAKGAVPRGFLLALGLPADWTEPWLAAFAQGLGSDARDFECPLLGGDTVRSPDRLFVSITAFGAVPPNRAVRRGGAGAGDRLYASGTIGDAALGLRLRRDPDAAARWALAADDRDLLLRRYRLPQPRLALAPALLRHASAAMDVSDGLAGDLGKLLRASRATAVVEIGCLPLSAAARRALDRDPGLIEDILSGGDDYEVLCAVPAGAAEAFEADAAESGVAVTRIGAVLAGEGPALLQLPGGESLKLRRASFSHF